MATRPPLAATVFTDGACSGNPGPGGWAAIVAGPDGDVRELGGSAAQTTNNRMEIIAAIEALGSLAAHDGPVVLWTDSKYVLGAAGGWIAGWKRRGWRKADGKPVLNQDLWERLDPLLAPRIVWGYVPGHAGNPGNARVDEIAVALSKGRPVTLYDGPRATDPDLEREPQAGVGSREGR